METLSVLLMLAAFVVGVVLLVKLFTAPIRWLLKLLLHAVLGFVLLFVVNFLGALFGFELEMNLLNALIVGFLGVPGVAILAVLKLLF